MKRTESGQMEMQLDTSGLWQLDVGKIHHFIAWKTHISTGPCSIAMLHYVGLPEGIQNISNFPNMILYTRACLKSFSLEESFLMASLVIRNGVFDNSSTIDRKNKSQT